MLRGLRGSRGAFARLAASVAPARVPTARAVESSPYVAAPLPKVLRASTARARGKFSPNVATMKTVASSTRRSGLDST